MSSCEEDLHLLVGDQNPTATPCKVFLKSWIRSDEYRNPATVERAPASKADYGQRHRCTHFLNCDLFVMGYGVVALVTHSVDGDAVYTFQ